MPNAAHGFASASFTRPADTTAYAVNDVVSNSTSTTTPMTLAAVGIINSSGGAAAGYITKVRLVTDNKAFTAQCRVWFFNSTSITVAADNAAFGPKWADRSARIGYVDLPTLAPEDSTASDCAEATAADQRVPFTCATNVNTLYAVIETKTASTPASGQLFYLEVETEIN